MAPSRPGFPGSPPFEGHRGLLACSYTNNQPEIQAMSETAGTGHLFGRNILKSQGSVFDSCVWRDALAHVDFRLSSRPKPRPVSLHQRDDGRRSRRTPGKQRASWQPANAGGHVLADAGSEATCLDSAYPLAFIPHLDIPDPYTLEVSGDDPHLTSPSLHVIVPFGR